jgi:hypothetical protein
MQSQIISIKLTGERVKLNITLQALKKTLVAFAKGFLQV